jgi:hypothetical protein
MAVKIEVLFSSMYTYYSQSPRKHLEHTRLAKMIESKGLNFFEEYQNEVDFHFGPF